MDIWPVNSKLHMKIQNRLLRLNVLYLVNIGLIKIVSNINTPFNMLNIKELHT